MNAQVQNSESAGYRPVQIAHDLQPSQAVRVTNAGDTTQIGMFLLPAVKLEKFKLPMAEQQ